MESSLRNCILKIRPVQRSEKEEKKFRIKSEYIIGIVMRGTSVCNFSIQTTMLKVYTCCKTVRIVSIRIRAVFFLLRTKIVRSSMTLCRLDKKRFIDN